MARCFRVNPADNVATMLDDGAAGDVEVLGGERAQITATEPIALGHKISLRAIATDEPILKFGVPIGKASREIPPGAWVHLHNCASNFDQRSQTLDLHSGAATDTRYE